MTSQIKERPILFSAPMVRAVLAGNKTQTRRIAKKQVRHPDLGNLYTPGALVLEHEPQHVIDRACPYGQPGDRLWVRETWQGPLIDDLDAYRAEPSDYNKPEFCEYAADGGAAPEFITLDDELVRRWRPSIHMPRWASRILLEVVSVRVERLNDISEADARAEGINDGGCLNCGNPEPCGCSYPAPYARDAFCRLWQSINGDQSWNDNPWVWVVEFKMIEGGAA